MCSSTIFTTEEINKQVKKVIDEWYKKKEDNKKGKENIKIYYKAHFLSRYEDKRMK